MSAVTLGKMCRKLRVPVPGRGHWAKLAYGKEGAKKPPLPKLDKIPVIYRSPTVQRKPATQNENDPEFAAINGLLASGALNPLPPDGFGQPHPLIRHTTSLLRSRSRKDEHAILLPREAGGLDVKVSEGMLERALLAMNQVLAVLERQGASVEISAQGYTTALINGEHVSFGIGEPIRKVVVQKPTVPNPTDRWDYDKVVTYEPTAKLVLVIRSTTGGRYAQRARWSDAKVRRVENLIADFVAGLLRTAVALRRQEAEDSKKREAEEQRRMQERAQLQKEIQEEEKRLEQFNNGVDLWERADRLRRFISAYAEKSRSWPAENKSYHQAWIEWATEQADRLDPFVSEKPPSALDRKGELNRW